jgi:DNA-binding NtrC family response regulator
MLRKAPSISESPAALPDFSPDGRGDPPAPVVLVVSRDGLLRWALYEALTAAHLRVLTCSDDSHAQEILPQVDADIDVAIIDDDTWPMTRSERNWLHVRWPDLPIIVLAHPGQDLEHRVQEVGLAEFLVKPFDVSDLLQLVERTLGDASSARRRAEHTTVESA